MVARDEPFTREEVVKALQDNEYTRVTFYKVNGELREMLCTLNMSELERIARSSDEEISKKLLFVAPDQVEERTHDENQVRVWDAENSGWRSFLISNLITLEGVNT